MLRIYDWQSAEIYVEVAAKPGDTLFFGWIHSLEHIPWNEYYHIDGDLNLVLDTITFPAFGAGIPENKGASCRIENGLIYMEEINQVFPEFLWLNSHSAVQEIYLNEQYITRGSELPSTDGVLTAEQAEMIEKLDKESATRKLSSPLLSTAFYWVCIIITFYHLYTVAFIPPATLKHRSLHVAMILALSFIMYPFGKNSSRKSVTWTALSNHLFANTEGIFGTSVQVAASYIFMFILFGAIMNKSGMGKFFNDIAMALAGHTKGGPAKVAVMASGLLGSINGSAVANVVTTGAFTIPLMKKVGYSKEFAGAVESSASVGGQLLPPVMGAAAFIMAEMLGIKYREIIICAAVPALLYYLGILVQVQLRASKENLIGVPKDRLPKTKQVMKERGHLVIPIILLLYLLMFTSMTVSKAAFFTIIANIVCAQLRKETRMSIKDIFDGLADGTRQTVPVAIACACVGVVIGVTAKTGFGLTMANAIVSIGQSNLMFTLIFTMITCMILGMGVPSIPAYIITASIAAPALYTLGIPLIAAHLFVFYFAMFANITPPVALAAMAASGVSGGNFMKTKVHMLLRFLSFAGALLLIDIRWQSDIIGLSILLLIALVQYTKFKRGQKLPAV